MYNYRARFYDPLTGSFTQPDSLVPDPLDPRAWNRFGYVYGNPANFTDPSGHCPFTPNKTSCINQNFIQGPPTDITPEEVTLIAQGLSKVSVIIALPLTIASSNTTHYLMSRNLAWVGSSLRPGGIPVYRPGPRGLTEIPTRGAAFAMGVSYALPIASGILNYIDIQARAGLGIISPEVAYKEKWLNVGYITANLGVTYVLNSLSKFAPRLTTAAAGSGTTALGTTLGSVVAAVSAGIVTTWEYETFKNKLEGMPSEQAWKKGRDATFEPFLNFVGFSREKHPEWYWYP